MKSKRTARTARSASRRGWGILCGTDLSDGSRNAVHAAGAIARRLRQPLYLVHAVEMPKLGASHAKVLKWLTASRRKGLRQEAEDVRKTGVQVEERIPAGRPDEVLVNLARTKSPQLLVVSSVGLRGADRWLVGSVSERTAERAIVPTLVVRDAQSLVRWARGKRPLKVFICFNFTATSESALRWVKDLAAIGPCDVVVGYVDWPAEQHARLGGGGSLPLEGNPPAVQAVLERDVTARADELLGGLRFRLRVEANWGRPDARLAVMAKEEEANLIVVGSHQYHGFERFWHTSASRGLLHHASMNVAVVPLLTRKVRGASVAPPVRRVLVTTDFSELGDAAIPHAYSVLQRGGTVHLVHVVVHPRELPVGKRVRGASTRTPGAPAARLVQSCVERLRQRIPAGAASRGILTQVEVVEGRDVAGGICQAAERLGVDVICLGSHGRSGLSEALLGSVARGVMSRSRRPLFVVRSQPR